LHHLPRPYQPLRLWYNRNRILKKRMAELKQVEIARLAGVSQATVSRVLKGDPQVNAEMRERVLAVVQRLGYVPDARAQSLRSQRTRLLGLVIHRDPIALAGDPFFSALIAMIVEQAGRYDYHLCVDTARTARSQRAVYEELLRTRRVDGLILVESETHDRRIERLSREGFPFVLIGRYEPEDAVCSVDNDNISAASMATDYLLRTGRRRGCLSGRSSGANCNARPLAGLQDRAGGTRYRLQSPPRGVCGTSIPAASRLQCWSC
jgi:DNA-binding LacI/PurR family transcriptional regulator